MSKVMSVVYYVRHRKTSEIRFVELGARYDQSTWELVCPVEVPSNLTCKLDKSLFIG